MPVMVPAFLNFKLSVMKLRAYKHKKEIFIIPRLGIMVEIFPQVCYFNIDFGFLIWSCYLEINFNR